MHLGGYQHAYERVSDANCCFPCKAALLKPFAKRPEVRTTVRTRRPHPRKLSRHGPALRTPPTPLLHDVSVVGVGG